MGESVLVAIITGIVTLVGVLIANAKSDAVQNERIEQLREEVKKNNNLIDRMYKAEKELVRHDDEFKHVNHRLEELEKRK